MLLPKMIRTTALLAIVGSFGTFASTVEDSLSKAEASELKTLINSDHRSEKTRHRNQYRHPLETLSFFGVKETHTVVEIWPGGKNGWYRSILAPYLEGTGTYIAVRGSDDFPEALDKVPDNSADRVLVFRAHGFMIYDNPAQSYFDALYKMLKPGGVFGIVDHRGDEAVPQDPKGESGYVNQSHVIKLAKKAGFVLINSSEINANPNDIKNYPEGLYSLPPSLKGSTFNKALRSQVLEIGESDRMTLKFTKL